MNLLNQIKDLESQVLRTWVKENLAQPEFLDSLRAEKETVIPWLLERKAFPEELNTLFTGGDVVWLLEQMLRAQFTPSAALQQQMLSWDPGHQELTAKLVEAFPTWAWTSADVVQLLNSQQHRAAVNVLKLKANLRNKEVILLLLKTQFIDQDFYQEVVDDQSVLEYFQNFLTASEDQDEVLLTTFMPSVWDLVLPKLDLTTVDLKIFADYLNEGYELAPATVEYLFLNCDSGNEPTYDHKAETWKYSQSLKWFPALEKMSEEINRGSRFILIENPPAGSRFRRQWLNYDPTEASVAELLTLSVKPHVVRRLLVADLSELQQISTEHWVERIINTLGPTDVAKSVRQDEERCKYFMEVFPTKYQAVFRKYWPREWFPELPATRKRSYFFEMFTAIKAQDVTEIRALAKLYSLQQFAIDSKQDSKRESCAQTTAERKLLVQLTKAELLDLLDSELRVYSYYDDSVSRFTYQWSLAESLKILDRLGFATVILHCADPVKFVKSEAISSEDVSSFINDHLPWMEARPEVLQASLKRVTKLNEKLTLNAEVVAKLAQSMTAAEIRKFLGFDYDMASYLLLKDSAGDFVIDQDQIKSWIPKNLENEEFILNLAARDYDFALEVIAAYLKGNKGLTKLLGQEVKIRRAKVDKLTQLQAQLQMGTEALIDQIYAAGGQFTDFEQKVISPYENLSRYHQGRPVRYSNITQANLDKWADYPQVKLVADSLALVSKNLDTEETGLWILPTQLTVSKIDLILEGELMGQVDSINKLQSQSVPVEIDFGRKTLSEMFRALEQGLRFPGWEGVLQTQISSLAELIAELGDGLTIHDLKFVVDHGGLITDEIVKVIIQQSPGVAVLEWLQSRVGDLSTQEFSLEWLSFDLRYEPQLQAQYIKQLQELKIAVYTEVDYNYLQMVRNIKTQGAEFSAFDVSSLTLDRKVELIRMIESIDSRYSQLKLTAMNLENLSELSPYAVMKSLYSLDDEYLKTLFGVPAGLATNKKLLAALKDLVAVHGVTLPQKLSLLQAVLHNLQAGLKLQLSDVVNYQNVSQLILTEWYENLNLEVLQMLKSYQIDFNSEIRILQGQDRGGVMGFLRSAMQEDVSYTRDIFQMLQKVQAGLRIQQERIQFNREDLADEQIVEIQQTIDSIEKRLLEVVQMDHAKHMHDRLVPLLSFLKQDPQRALGQDKFRKLEQNVKVCAPAKVRLFFPKTFADLSYLGDHNGWCVNRHSNYGENVINHGNILVGLCPADQEPIKENVVALAHFTKEATGYSLEQLRWSNRIKNDTNVDATRDFDYRLILGIIKEYLSAREAKK